MICASLRAGPLDSVRSAMLRAAAQGAGLIELRLDYNPALDLAALMREKPCPLLVTARSREQGGAYPGDESSRLALLQRAADLGADYIDWEVTSPRVIDRKSSRLVVSMHTSDPWPKDWDRFVGRAREVRADVLKVATTPKSSSDVLRLIEFSRSCPDPHVFIPMGPIGEAVRVMYKKFGNLWSYAAPEAGEETAPGQATLEDMASLYCADRISGATRVFAVIGNPVAHSRSPEVFNGAFRRLNMDAVYVRLPVDNSISLRHAVQSYGLAGASVTVPHKAAAVSVCDDLDPPARAIGAVNTLVVHDGRVKGYNTDGEAAVEAIQTDGSVRGKNVLVLGAGGTARAIVACLVRVGARVSIANRTETKAQHLAEEFRCAFVTMSDMYRTPWDIVINATSVGMAPNVDDSPVEAGLFRKGMAVFDVVYTPPQTRFLTEARKAGAVAIGGREMFVRQAAKQFELFFDRPMPEVMRAEWGINSVS